MEDAQEQFLLETAIQNGEIIEIDNKILAKTSWLRPWPKNPREVEDKDISRLKRQIVNLKIYKPIVITLGNNYGEVIGGCQRLKALKELDGEGLDGYDFVWVSIVEAPSDAEKLVYAVSDNDIVGKYTREKVMEAIPELGGQDSLFEDYRFNFGTNKTLDNLKSEIDLTEDQLKEKMVVNQLQDAGVNEETIDAVLQMSKYNKKNNKLEDVDIQGELSNERFPIQFWCINKLDYEYLKTVFSTGRKYDFNTEKLIEITKKYERENDNLSTVQ